MTPFSSINLFLPRRDLFSHIDHLPNTNEVEDKLKTETPPPILDKEKELNKDITLEHSVDLEKEHSVDLEKEHSVDLEKEHSADPEEEFFIEKHEFIEEHFSPTKKKSDLEKIEIPLNNEAITVELSFPDEAITEEIFFNNEDI